ncbi:MAG: TRAP transporter small permease [Deltaproteobacteria bacterium]|nr:TRAP transporter small permease [Deltaproteobacteria bacterium]MBW2307295.1 TRAP transporter small permease [Deltaproteobacteria bacterium]
MKRIARVLVAGINGLTWFSETLAELGLLALLILVFREVVARYFFSSPTIYSVEISEYLLIFITFLCVGWVLKENRHVRMLAIHTRLSKNSQAYMEIFSCLLIMLFCVVLVWEGIESVIVAYRGDYHSSSLLNFPLWISYSFIPYGALVLGLQCTVVVGRHVQGLRKHEEASSSEYVA